MEVLNYFKCIQEDRKKIMTFVAELNSEYASPEWKYGIFRKLALLAESHAKAFESTILEFAKNVEELRPLALESLEISAITDELINKIRITEDPQIWETRVKVACDLFESQLHNEARRLLPDVCAYLEVIQTPAFINMMEERYELKRELGLGLKNPWQLRFFSPLLNEAG